MRICLVYHRRLGDIIRIFPIAKHLAWQGHDVRIECDPQYAGIVSCISYAKASLPEHRSIYNFGQVLDFQIWPDRYNDFRQSSKTWEQFVFSIYPEFKDVDPTIDFDLMDEFAGLREYGISEPICLVSPFGYSQAQRYPLMALIQAARSLSDLRMVILSDSNHYAACLEVGLSSSDLLCAKTQADLPRLIQEASHFFTINSAPCIIAGSVRSSFWHVSSGLAQDDSFSEASRIVTIDT